MILKEVMVEFGREHGEVARCAANCMRRRQKAHLRTALVQLLVQRGHTCFLPTRWIARDGLGPVRNLNFAMRVRASAFLSSLRLHPGQDINGA
ncbi:MAG: hypothetical protein KY442_04235 [Proteobacteria bacterium]|nr:hypothetical protein [Pseudomonadota bacterium]